MLRLVDRVIAGDEVTDAEVNGNFERLRTLFWIMVGLVLLAIVVFTRWLRTAYENVDAVPHGERRYGYGWAIGGWFVPIMAFWRPKEIVNDVWRSGGRDSSDREPGWLLLSWWLLWLFSGFVLRIGDNLYTGAETPEELRTGTIVYLVGDAMLLGAAVLAVAVVRIATERLDGRAAERTKPLPPEHPDGDLPAPAQPVGAAP